MCILFITDKYSISSFIRAFKQSKALPLITYLKQIQPFLLKLQYLKESKALPLETYLKPNKLILTSL